MTEFDKIKQMSAAEMTTFLRHIYDSGCKNIIAEAWKIPHDGFIWNETWLNANIKVSDND